jgi:HEAT repeat protein
LVALRGELSVVTLPNADSGDELLLVTLHSEKPSSEVQDGLPSVEALATPSIVALSREGAVQSIRQTKQVDVPTRRLLESFMRELQVRTPVCGGEREWSAQEQLVGLRVMSHFKADANLHDLAWSRKEILEWSEASSLFPVNGRATELKTSVHHASFDAEGHVERLSGRDELLVELGDGGEHLMLKTTIELSPIGGSKVAAGAATAVETASFANPSSHSEIADAARVAGHDVKSLVAELARQNTVKPSEGPNRNRLFVAASALFRRDEAAAAEAAELIRKGHAESKFLLAALGEAGTLQSATLLADVLRDASGDRATEALIALGKARLADASIVDAMAAELRDPRQAGTAQLMLGALAAHTYEDSPDASARATDTLVASYDASEDVLARADALRGLGNSGSLQALEVARRGAASPNPIERAAAAQALRRIPSDAADRLLGTLLEDEADSVRRSAFDAALYRDPTEILVPVVERAARLESSASVRREAIRVLVRWKDQVPSARGTLVWASLNDPEDDLRKVAAEGLTRPAQ